jgi:ABC-type Zn2+ transport system substrate-binding protein/surface adhesin
VRVSRFRTLILIGIYLFGLINSYSVVASETVTRIVYAHSHHCTSVHDHFHDHNHEEVDHDEDESTHSDKEPVPGSQNDTEHTHEILIGNGFTTIIKPSYDSTFLLKPVKVNFLTIRKSEKPVPSLASIFRPPILV